MQPDWVDTSKIAIPQADEQQRLLVNLITLMERDKLPLPHFWYLPRGEKAVVVMSGDDHSPSQAPGGTASNFDRFKALSPAGCVVANWECVRSTVLHLSRTATLTNAQAAALHSPTASRSRCTRSSARARRRRSPQAELAAVFDTQLAAFQAKYTSVPAPVSSRTHCVYWPDWASNAKVELARGIRMDANYYHYPGAWIGAKPGFMNGGGFPMRFADLDGSLIDVYQANTNMTDESAQAYPATVDALLDNALGPLGYYGAFGTNIHNDNPAPQPGRRGDRRLGAGARRAGDLLQAAARLGRRPQRLDDPRPQLERRHASPSSPPSAPGANGLQTMLPTQGPTGTLSALTCARLAASPTRVQTIKGIQYAVFTTVTGTCQATYS